MLLMLLFGLSTIRRPVYSLDRIMRMAVLIVRSYLPRMFAVLILLEFRIRLMPPHAGHDARSDDGAHDAHDARAAQT